MKSITQISKELGVTYRTVYLWYEKFEIDIIFYRPDYNKLQQSLYEYIKSVYKGEIKYNDINTLPRRKELDIYIPELNFAIEFNGCYWHREDKDRHLNKLNLCNEKGIDLIQFWDYEWIKTQDICESIIKNKLKLNKEFLAKDCEIRLVNKKDSINFIESNYIKGSAPIKLSYGLYYKEMLLSIISLNNIENNWRVVLYCDKIGYDIIRGFEKLLEYFISVHNPNKIEIICDRRIDNGEIYKNNGFQVSCYTPPEFFYCKGNKILKLEDINNKVDNEIDEKWFKVYDCGNSIWTK